MSRDDVYDDAGVNATTTDGGGDDDDVIDRVIGHVMYGGCSEWREAQDVLYQVASLFFAVAFLVPDVVRCHVMLLRATLCLGCACLVAWGGVVLCHVDVIVWYLVFLAVNIFHLVYAVSDGWPTRMPADVEDVYAKLFRPLRVDRQTFRDLAVGHGHVTELPVAGRYAVEGTSRTGETLSILLVGR